MVEHFAKEFEKKHKKDMSTNKKAMRRLRVACEKAKRALSSSEMARIDIESLHGGQDFSVQIRRALFEDLNKDLFSQLVGHIDKALRDADMDKSEIDDVVLIGGSSRIPKIQELLQDYFEDKDLSKSINPDEAVAYGAAILAAKLSGERSVQIDKIEVKDVIPLSIGCSTRGDIMSVTIPRNTSIPVRRSHTYVTVEDNQTEMNIPIYEGEREVASENHFLGTFKISNLPLAPAGSTEVKEIYEIDGNGLLTVTAVDGSCSTNREMITIKDSGSLGKDEIEKMTDDAQKFKISDEKRMKAAKAKNNFEDYILKTKSTIRNARSTSSEEISNALKTCDEVLDWLDDEVSLTCEEIQEKEIQVQKIVGPLLGKIEKKIKLDNIN